MSYEIPKSIVQDCTTCHFNFGEGRGCASRYYGTEVEEIMKDASNFPCGGYKLDFSLYMELAGKGEIEEYWDVVVIWASNKTNHLRAIWYN